MKKLKYILLTIGIAAGAMLTGCSVPKGTELTEEQHRDMMIHQRTLWTGRMMNRWAAR